MVDSDLQNAAWLAREPPDARKRPFLILRKPPLQPARGAKQVDRVTWHFLECGGWTPLWMGAAPKDPKRRPAAALQETMSGCLARGASPLLVRRAGLSGTAIPPRCSTIVVVDFP